MTDFEFNVDNLKQSVAMRRDARKTLRELAQKLADRLTSALRVGDAVELTDDPWSDREGVRYSIQRAVSAARPLQSNGEWGQRQYREVFYDVLVRSEGTREAIMGDPRSKQDTDEDGDSWLNVGNTLYSPGVLQDSDHWQYEIPLATDEERLLFAQEAPEVLASFQKHLNEQVQRMNAANEMLRGLAVEL